MPPARSGDSRSRDSGKGADDEDEVLSPMKTNAAGTGERNSGEEGFLNTSRQLFQAKKGDGVPKTRKRKPKGVAAASTPDLNLPAVDTSALIPLGLVSSRVQDLAKFGDGSEITKIDDLPKKQKHSSKSQNAGSAAAAGGSPRRAQ